MAYNTYKDQEKLRAYLRRKSRKRYARVRIESIRILGGKCKICKIDDYRVLQVDHIVPIGLGSRRLSNMQIFPKIVRGDYPLDNLQLLCANCHMIKTTEERKPDI